MLSGDTSVSMSRYVKLQNCFAESTTSVDWVLGIILQKVFFIHFVFSNCVLLLSGHSLNVYLICSE